MELSKIFYLFLRDFWTCQTQSFCFEIRQIKIYVFILKRSRKSADLRRPHTPAIVTAAAAAITVQSAGLPHGQLQALQQGLLQRGGGPPPNCHTPSQVALLIKKVFSSFFRRRGAAPPDASLHCKKGYRFSHIIDQTLPSRESLVSDIPAGNGKMANLFFTV